MLIHCNLHVGYIIYCMKQQFREIKKEFPKEV